jgi:arylsulfatase A-like enzyme
MVLRRIGAILAAWILLIAAEHLAVGIGYRALFAGTWEMASARTLVTPILYASLGPLAALAYAISRVRAPNAITTLGALAGGAIAFGVSTGRHFATWDVRAPFIVLFATVGGAVVLVLTPRLARLAQERPVTLAVIGGGGAALFWLADAFVLPRLYPAFHLALFALTLASAALASVVLRLRWIAEATILLGCACVAWAPFAARRLQSADNVRMVLLEHAPLLGKGVALGSILIKPAEETASNQAAAPGEIARALDWSRTDIVLLSVDALRADHLGAYGYPRATTPRIDALAREGKTFLSAYCPTPHTSYSVTSMMSGKYMRPLLGLGLGDDSDTWAGLLRRYGYRTAAFYPPAVFFIDEQRFQGFRDRGLDFEYRRVEFATPGERVAQVEKYLSEAPTGAPIFLWVHLFEPHEPYVQHPGHVFGETDLDAYDSEIAEADEGIGGIVDRVRAHRPNAVIILTADHGEEFGEHGGRYHGTTVYEEQVRVPLIIVGAGVAPGRVEDPVQTIDLLPTTLSALGIPRPARLRGRDLGPILADPKDKGEPGVAFAETDNYTLLARGTLRLVCARRAGACALYDPKSDPKETRDLSTERPADAKALRAELGEITRAHGRFEQGTGPAWPEAIRRGMWGDREAAEDVAALLDDASLDVRKQAAKVTFALHAPEAVPAARRALAKSDDAEVKDYCALALVRMGEPVSPLAEALAHDAAPAWRRRAALAFAERGDARGGGELGPWFAADAATMELDEAKELLAAIGTIHERAAVAPLVAALEDVRLRPFIADTLGQIGDPSARAPLLARFSEERFVTTRPNEARALLRLGARAELRAPLTRFAGIPEPMASVLAIAREAKILEPKAGGWSSDSAVPLVQTSLTVTKGTTRLLLLGSPEVTTFEVTLDGRPLPLTPAKEGVSVIELPPLAHGEAPQTAVEVRATPGVLALWIVARTAEIPPPAPKPWTDGGSSDVDRAAERP